MTQATPALPPGVDFSVQEAMSAGQLQELLRQDFNGPQLAQANVVVSKPLMPWLMTISGGLNIYGDIHFWETELDVRRIETADDFLLLVKQLHTSFDRAATQVGRPA